MSTYARFTEVNDWEGETWHFWLPIEGNEEALRKLAELLDVEADSDEYQLSLEPRDELHVDALVDEDDEPGYMSAQNKLEGVLTVPDTLGENCKALYKGDIAKMFSPSR
jgi:hypothetical protein